jgi:hypothetical protein
MCVVEWMHVCCSNLEMSERLPRVPTRRHETDCGWTQLGKDTPREHDTIAALA